MRYRRLFRPSVGLVLLLILVSGCSVLRVDGPYHGRVVDKETRQPLAGTLVLAQWDKEAPSLGHDVERLFKVEETVTDQNGDFTIRGLRGGSFTPLSTILRPTFVIFKLGYVVHGGRIFDPGPPLDDPDNIEKYEEAGRMVFALGRLTTREERLKNLRRLPDLVCHPNPLLGPSRRHCVHKEKVPNFIRLLNAEEAALGLKPSYSW